MTTIPGTTGDQTELDAATLARFRALSADERAGVCRLVAMSSCTVAQAIVAIEATRPAPLATTRKAHR